MRLPKRLYFLPFVTAFAISAGCGSSTPSAPALAPAKSLSPAEESLLKELEAIAPAKRQEFVMRHMGEISRYSAGNRTFGERMDAAVKGTAK